MKARDAIKLVNVPPNPFGMVLTDTLPSVNDVGVPVTHDMYRVPNVPVALMQIPIGWLAGNESIVLPKGMAAAVELPALVAVAERPSTQPLAAETLGVVWPVTNTPPSRYQTSTGPVVPAAAEKTLVMPVKKMG